MFDIKVDFNPQEALQAISSLKNELTSSNGAFRRYVKFASTGLIKQAVKRYQKAYPNRAKKRGPDIKRAIIDAGVDVIQDTNGETTIAFFDERVLDNLTSLKKTVTTGYVYHLWRLLSAGWGPLGSDDPSRGAKGLITSYPYPLFVVIQNSALNISGKYSSSLDITGSYNRYPPFPDIVRLENNPGVVVVRHPGHSGREWFLKNGELFTKDKKLIQKAVDKGLKAALIKAGFRA